MPKSIWFACVALLLCGQATADDLIDRLEELRPSVREQFSVPIEPLRLIDQDIPGAAQPGFDDSTWKTITAGATWNGKNRAWLRGKITLPTTIAGKSTDSLPARLQVGTTSEGEIYIDGQLKEEYRNDQGDYMLSEHTRPGESFNIAIQVMRGPADSQLHFARVYFDVLPELDAYLDELSFMELLIDYAPAEQKPMLKQALKNSEAAVHFTKITKENLDTAKTELATARAALEPVAAYTKKFDVYCIGHSHIDMCWQWSWPETIDVCHRTWNSAMNLMDLYPHFDFVQSQPAAYVPIEAQFPDEFARMQQKSKDGQWDIVGGMWNESDTNIPSGEGLAKSFLLGQRYFKSKFGRYAITGWLPDSFGHSWQMPQIMKLSGINYFYHMRCGNGLEFAWWESPDGSRVLKANTLSYDTKPKIEDFLGPIENKSRLGMTQSLAVFGVGDHGGGPTRNQILHVQALQHDPIFPNIHFTSADQFFQQLAKQPQTASLPIVDGELQYTFEGCYTTHPDIKTAIRRSENNLYSAEVLSSLAAMMGKSYPVAEFQDAWKPTTFAQFHDIACGTAVYPTYEWMHEQLKPAFDFEQKQIDQKLDELSNAVDSSGKSENAIVVWNTLSFPRTDIAHTQIEGAAKYHSVIDANGNRHPAQIDGKDLCFIAHDVPAMSYAVFYPDTQEAAASDLSLHDGAKTIDLENPTLQLQIDKATGAITKLYSKPAKWNAFENTPDANAFELLGDDGNPWTIIYNGQDQILRNEGAKVEVIEKGPAFARLRVTHTADKSTYTQDITLFADLPRVDIPTTVQWHEVDQLLKVRLPINATNVTATAQIPFGFVERPTTGQECPGQKWMDVSKSGPVSAETASPLDLSAIFNAQSTKNFDGDGNAFPVEVFPAAGMNRLGSSEVPFTIADARAGKKDNVIASGQEVPLANTIRGDTLYLLCATPKGKHGTTIGFRLPDGRTEFRPFDADNWAGRHPGDNDVALTFNYRRTPNGGKGNTRVRLYIAHVPFSSGATALLLPNDPKLHLFAATIATKHTEIPYGLSILNDSKYGFDVWHNVFRLTALRSTMKHDTRGDQGEQKFTYSLYPHAGDWRSAHTEEQALALNIPLLAKVVKPHASDLKLPKITVTNSGGRGDLVVSCLGHSEEGAAFILRIYEAAGQDTTARIECDHLIYAEQTDILERPLAEQHLDVIGDSVTLPVGHNRIVTLRLAIGATPQKTATP